MNIASMLRDVTESLLKRPVTQKYPFEKTAAPDRLRGRLYWDPAKCTGCGLCVKDCPADAIELVVNDKKAKVFVMRYSADKCIFCAQCTHNCRFDCLEMSDTDWELAQLSKEPYLMYWGPEQHVKAYMESLNAPPELVAAIADGGLAPSPESPIPAADPAAVQPRAGENAG